MLFRSKEEKLFHAVGSADEKLPAKSEKKVKVHWVKWCSIVAGIILIACAGSYLLGNYMNSNVENIANGPLHITVNSVNYNFSWHSEQECPDGFEYAGTINSAIGGASSMVLNCKYYVNAEIPSWIYVYTNLMSGFPELVGNDVPDSTTTNANGKVMTYVRFVAAEALYKRCIFYNGQLYQSMWSYMAGKENDESLLSAFKDLESRYGIQTETIPEVCVLAGSAHLEEEDRIPKTELGVNFKEYDHSAVYTNPNDSKVLYVGTSWHTATEAEKVDTLHNGYDVFVLYTPN